MGTKKIETIFPNNRHRNIEKITNSIPYKEFLLKRNASYLYNESPIPSVNK